MPIILIKFACGVPSLPEIIETMRPNRILATTLCALTVLLSAGCDAPENTVENRWYTTSQVQRGKAVFQANCASCHGARAQGLTADWKRRTADGSFPPPPLNGAAHTWHHPLSILVRVINEGGIALGGKMPGFEDKLNDDDILAGIAYVQSIWPDEVYSRWKAMGGVDR